jgi:hypothetical protein
MVNPRVVQVSCWAVLGALCGCGADASGSRGDPPAASRAGSGGQPAGSAGGGALPHDLGNAGIGNAGAGSAATGNAGGDAEAPVGGADPGTFTPSAMLDPNVTFDWPEAEEGGKCEPGTYTGSFSCAYNVDPTQVDPLFAPPPDLQVTGPITLTFQRSENGEFLELANARIDGAAMDIIGFGADLSGRLDCATMQLTAEVTGGQFGFGQPILLQFGEVYGTLSGMLDGKTGTLTGEWSLSPGADMSAGTCKGPWMASYTP